MLPQTPQPNSKRYWGEERNIDSIYSIYLKKISYTYNNDISLSATHANQNSSSFNHRRGSQDDSITSSTSTTASNELSRYAIKNRSANNNNDSQANNLDTSNCQKPKESPRGRRNFFLKYRRRSCSMDKYSIDKHHQQQQQANQSSLTTPKGKNMKFTSSSSVKKSSKNNDLSINHDEIDGRQRNNSGSKTPLDFVDHQLDRCDLLKSMKDLSSPKTAAQSLQWETRQIKVLQAATLDHALKFILLINPSKDFNNSTGGPAGEPIEDDGGLEEERNNVAHIIHVMFCTYRIYTNPHELMLKLMDYSDLCRIEQYRFVMHYWMDNYPEDFDYPTDNSDSNRDSSSIGTSTNAPNHNLSSANPSSKHSHNNSITSFDSATTTRTAATTDSENSVGPKTTHSDNTHSGLEGSDHHLDRRLSGLSLGTADGRSSSSSVPLVNELLRLCRDEYIRTKASKLREMKSQAALISNGEVSRRSRHHNQNGNGSKNSAILDLDSRYVAQQLTAIDLGNFLGLKPYSLLEGTKTDKKIQNMVKNFNLLSRHVVITILRSHSPNIVASHWIAIALNLRKIKNFNSLKAIIAGLTNESVYRLKQTVWAKIDRTTMTNFKQMASIVDDVNNQTVLRQTQLIVEGTAKMSAEDESFGTIPYLGTFLTDLNMIDARYPSYVPSPKDETSKLKLINFDKCAKQFEILTQVQLLQKNVLASLHAIQRRNHFDEQTTLNRLKLEFSQNQQMLLARPAVPQVSKLFENWFYDHNVATMTDKQW